jgi:hypothetical protein
MSETVYESMNRADFRIVLKQKNSFARVRIPSYLERDTGVESSTINCHRRIARGSVTSLRSEDIMSYYEERV